jgi:hypothetical protein
MGIWRLRDVASSEQGPQREPTVSRSETMGSTVKIQ